MQPTSSLQTSVPYSPARLEILPVERFTRDCDPLQLLTCVRFLLLQDTDLANRQAVKEMSVLSSLRTITAEKEFAFTLGISIS